MRKFKTLYESILKELKLTDAMMKGYYKTANIKKSCECGFVLPNYPGRYPKKCPKCMADLNLTAKPTDDEDDVELPVGEPTNNINMGNGGDAIQESMEGTTSKDNGHTHTYKIDEDGNGKTSTDQDHMHDITNWKVAEANDHIHTIKKKMNESAAKWIKVIKQYGYFHHRETKGNPDALGSLYQFEVSRNRDADLILHHIQKLFPNNEIIMKNGEVEPIYNIDNIVKRIYIKK